MSVSIQPIPFPYTEAQCEALQMQIFLFASHMHLYVSDPQDLSNSFTYTFKLQQYAEVEELIFNYPFLVYNYKSVLIAFQPAGFVLIPADFDDESRSEWWLSSAAYCMHDANYVDTFAPKLPGGPHVITAWNKECYTFLRRTYMMARILPLPVWLMEQHFKQSIIVPGKLFTIMLGLGFIDIVVWKRGKLLYCNRIDISKFSENNIGSVNLSEPLNKETEAPTKRTTPPPFPGTVVMYKTEEEETPQMPEKTAMDDAPESSDVDDANQMLPVVHQLVFYFSSVCHALNIEDMSADTVEFYCCTESAENPTIKEQFAEVVKGTGATWNEASLQP